MKAECAVLDIHGIMKELSEKRPIFHSEADFRCALAEQIRETGVSSEIEFEFRPSSDDAVRLDVWVADRGTVVELKYPTETFNIEHEGERFELKESGLHEHGYYDCVKDISRLEQTVAKHSDVHSGVFVLLTHRPAFWKETRPSARSAVYSLHEGRTLEGNLAYRDNSRPPINLRGTYELRWQPYSDLGSSKFALFRYLAVEVGG